MAVVHHALRSALRLGLAAALLAAPANAAGPPPTSKARAKVVVYNLIENNRPQCPIVGWKFVKAEQGTFRGVSHPGRGKLLTKVTVNVEWAGVMFWHEVRWTVVGDKALPFDTNPLPSVVYRDRDAEWIGKGCPGCPPFGQC